MSCSKDEIFIQNSSATKLFPVLIDQNSLWEKTRVSAELKRAV